MEPIIPRKTTLREFYASIMRLHTPKDALSKIDAMIIISLDEFSLVIARGTFFTTSKQEMTAVFSYLPGFLTIM